ncbi:MAG: sterol desaturase family protein [Archangium sp.]|nr:sterol desaturase family protein [Archangium sp.]
MSHRLTVLLRNPLALIFLAMLFVPLERIWTLREQKILRTGWQTDVLHFFATHVLQQLALAIGVGLAVGLVDPLVSKSLQAAVASQHGAVQFLEAILIVEVIGYWMHRAFHTFPAMWRIHAVHHSSEHLDWLASLRVHPLDQTITRSVQFVPLYLLGFSQATFGGLVLFIGLWAVFLHANVRLRFGLLEHVLATPHFHHWHHAGEAQVNFSGLFPWVDRIFGTRATTKEWPASYGCDAPVPRGWWKQIAWPFARTVEANGVNVQRES